MPALNFEARFAFAVMAGLKKQTIRRVWKRPIRRGDYLSFYTGLRTKGCKCLGEGTCVGVVPIRIEATTALIDGYEAGWTERYRLAAADGFKDWFAFSGFFKAKYGLPFDGVLILWRPQ